MYEYICIYVYLCVYTYIYYVYVLSISGKNTKGSFGNVY